MTTDPAAVTATYFEAWKTKDFETLRSVLADSADVLTWFHLHTSVAPPAATANWSHVVGGKTSRTRVTFDARGFGGPN